MSWKMRKSASLVPAEANETPQPNSSPTWSTAGPARAASVQWLLAADLGHQGGVSQLCFDSNPVEGTQTAIDLLTKLVNQLQVGFHLKLNLLRKLFNCEELKVPSKSPDSLQSLK